MGHPPQSNPIGWGVVHKGCCPRVGRAVTVKATAVGPYFLRTANGGRVIDSFRPTTLSFLATSSR